MQSPAHRLLTPRRRTNCNGLVLRHCRPSPFSHLSVSSFFPLLFSLSSYLTPFELTSLHFCSVGRVTPHWADPLVTFRTHLSRNISACFFFDFQNKIYLEKIPKWNRIKITRTQVELWTSSTFFFLVQHSAFIQRERREGKRAFSGLDEGTGDEGKEATVIRNLEKKRRELARIVGCGACRMRIAKDLLPSSPIDAKFSSSIFHISYFAPRIRWTTSAVANETELIVLNSSRSHRGRISFVRHNTSGMFWKEKKN